MKMEGVDIEIQHHIGGTFLAVSVGALDKTQETGPEKGDVLFSSKTALCSAIPLLTIILRHFQSGLLSASLTPHPAHQALPWAAL